MALEVRYNTDAAGEPHIYAHNVSEAEVEDVLSSPDEDRPGSEGSRVAVGRTREGRVLRVIYAAGRPPRGGIFVITAYELPQKQWLAYRRRMRRRGK